MRGNAKEKLQGERCTKKIIFLRVKTFWATNEGKTMYEIMITENLTIDCIWIILCNKLILLCEGQVFCSIVYILHTELVSLAQSSRNLAY